MNTSTFPQLVPLPNMKHQQLEFLIQTCNKKSNLKQIHAKILRQNLHEKTSSTISTIIPLYASLSPQHFNSLLISLSNNNNNNHNNNNNATLFHFNNSIKLFSKNPSQRALSFRVYAHMVSVGCGVMPDNYTYPFLLNACSGFCDIRRGVEVHCRVLKCGFLLVVEVCNALVDMYGKCGDLRCARNVFDEMPVRLRDVVSYNAVLGACAKGGGDMGWARVVFDGMPVRNLISWNAMVVGYVNSGELGLARVVFDMMPERNVVSWTTILVGYTKKGLMDLAVSVFDDMPGKSLVCWTAMISGFAQNKRANEALEYFRRMQETRVKPDAFTMTAVISALAQLGRPELANWISNIVEHEGIERNERVLTALADMHAKCGNIEEACRLFDEIHKPDLFAFSALITGLASNGEGVKALEVFHKMLLAKIKPDHVTFVGVLSACNHAGLVDDGLRYWESMINEYNIEPNADHYGCIVDMLGRAGRLEQAFEMLQRLPTGPHPGALGSLLAACRTYNNVEIAEHVAKELFELEPENTGNYVLLSGIYAARGEWDMAATVRRAMKEKINTKLPGCSMIDLNGCGKARMDELQTENGTI